jgi:hypothetical protein
MKYQHQYIEQKRHQSVSYVQAHISHNKTMQIRSIYTTSTHKS